MDEESEAIYPVACELEQRIAAEPITCLADLAAKVVALSIYGDNALPQSVSAECEAILARDAASAGPAVT